jgi:hypothetical protein
LEAEVAIGKGRSDLVIKFSDFVVVIELKRIRLNALVPSDTLESEWPRNLPRKVHWPPSDLERLISFLKCQAIDELINCGQGKSGDSGSSLLRSFLTQLKSIPNTVAFSEFRTFITGITPLVLADASGYNVAYNISLDRRFGDMIGFYESDISETLHKYLQLNEQEQTRVLDIMRSHYDGYLFPGSTKRLYNSTLASFFLHEMIMKPEFKDVILNSKFDPECLMDTNTKISDRDFSGFLP